MAPTGNRQTTNAKAQQAWQLRVAGRSWSDVAHEAGYGSHASVIKAVKKWLEKNPPDELQTMRRASGDQLSQGIVKLLKAADRAEERGELRTMAELMKIAFDGIDKRAKIRGEHVAPPTTEVNVNITTTEALAEYRARLHEVIDAEVVDPPAPKALDA